MFHATWTTFKFNRNQLGTVSAYAMWPWLIALLMWTLKWLSSIEIQCHKGFYLKPKAAISSIEISSLICKTISIFNEHNFQYLHVVHSPTVKFFAEQFFANDLMGMLITPWHGDHDKRWNRSQLVPIEFRSGPSYVKHTVIRKKFIEFYCHLKSVCLLEGVKNCLQTSKQPYLIFNI